MTPEENIRRSKDERVRFIKDHIQDMSSKKPFVFISYKSDDWETVLGEIVYRLIKDYGLNVYFDGSFDIHNSLWISQFPENMESPYCKAVLAFMDMKYAASYACLLELMYSQTLKASNGSRKKGKGLPVIPVNLNRFKDLSIEEGEKDTGLGVERFDDGEKNVNARTEKELFDETLDELLDRGVLKEARYIYKKGKLKKSTCNDIVIELVRYLKINENLYTKENLDGFLKNIRMTIESEVGNEVFSEPISEPLTESLVKPSPDFLVNPVPSLKSSNKGIKEIELSKFIKEYNNKTFNSKSYSRVKLTGKGEYIRYSTDFYSSTFEMVWNWMMRILNERKMEYIQFVNSQNTGKNPIFITAQEHQRRKDNNESVTYKKIDADGLGGYSMLRHFSQYDWIHMFLRQRLNELELPVDAFVLEFEGLSGVENEPEIKDEEKAEENKTVDDEITEPVPVNGKNTGTKKSPDKTICYLLYGKSSSGDQKQMMCDVFEQVIARHPQKLDELIQSISCLSYKDYTKDGKNAQPSCFRVGKLADCQGIKYFIGASLGIGTKLNYIGKLFAITGESKENLQIQGYTY